MLPSSTLCRCPSYSPLLKIRRLLKSLAIPLLRLLLMAASPPLLMSSRRRQKQWQSPWWITPEGNGSISYLEVLLGLRLHRLVAMLISRIKLYCLAQQINYALFPVQIPAGRSFSASSPGIKVSALQVQPLISPP